MRSTDGRSVLWMACGLLFIESIYFSTLTPLLPHYAASLHLSAGAAGVLVAAYPAGSLAGALPSGLLTMRYGAKRTVLCGLVFIAVLGMLFCFRTGFWLLAASRLGQGAGASLVWTGALVWLISETDPARRAGRLGTAAAAATAGSIAGPAVGTLAALTGTGFAFGLVAGVATVAGFWVLGVASPSRRPVQPMSALALAMRRPTLIVALWILTVSSLGLGVLAVLAPLRLGELGTPEVTIGGIFLGGAAIQCVVSMAAGRWADGHGLAGPLRVGLLCSAGTSIWLALSSGRVTLASAVPIAGAAYVTLFGPTLALLAKHADAEGLDITWAFTLLTLAWCPGLLAGASAGGLLSHLLGEHVPYGIVACSCLITLLFPQRWLGGIAAQAQRC